MMGVMTFGESLVPTRSLVYLSYGGKDVQVAETKYAILSALRVLKPSDGIGILLYTDLPNLYSDLQVEIRAISPHELEEWMGPGKYQYRRKAEVVRDALARKLHPVAFIDSDTWFVKSPDLLFDLIGPGRTVLHVKEGPIGDSHYGPNNALAKHFDTHHYGAGIGAESVVWNSGVIGLDPADARLVGNAITLIDQIWAAFPMVDTLEQFAISHHFAAETTVRAVDDVVFHYWPAPLRKPFHTVLVDAVERTKDLPPLYRANVLHPLRPRLRGLNRLKHGFKELYRSTGRRWPNSIPGNAT